MKRGHIGLVLPLLLLMIMMKATVTRLIDGNRHHQDAQHLPRIPLRPWLRGTSTFLRPMTGTRERTRCCVARREGSTIDTTRPFCPTNTSKQDSTVVQLSLTIHSQLRISGISQENLNFLQSFILCFVDPVLCVSRALLSGGG